MTMDKNDVREWLVHTRSDDFVSVIFSELWPCESYIYCTQSFTNAPVSLRYPYEMMLL